MQKEAYNATDYKTILTKPNIFNVNPLINYLEI